MDSSIVAALIAAGSAPLVLYAGVHAQAMIRRHQKKQKSEEDAEAKTSEYNERLVLLMCAIREVSRRQIERFVDIQEKMENEGTDLSRQEVRSIFNVMHYTTSSQTDVALKVGLTCPAVRDRWFYFLDLRTQYMEGVDDFTHEVDLERRRELSQLLEQLKAARNNLVEEMKIAAERLGCPLLLRDADVDDAGAP
ncbi:hypothetical protein [Streptomyces sp. NPDC005046]